MANYITGTFTATGVSDTIQLTGPFNITLRGPFSATVSLERSFYPYTVWDNCSTADLSDNAFTAPISTTAEEPENAVFYRLNCTAFTSGTVSYRLSQ